jgi:uncharacterized protein YPO0396
MRLVNVGLVHWHTYPISDIAIEGGVTAIVGRNGVGKSTVLDAIQVVMTGGAENVKLNKRAAAADRSAGDKLSKRSIHSYCLGRLDAATTIRETSATYLLLGFVDPTPAKKPPVTLMLAFEAASSEAKHTLVTRAIVQGVLLKAEHLAPRGEDGRHSVESWYDCRDRINAFVKESGSTIEEYRGSAKEFIGEYMHALMYRRRTNVQDQFISNFLNCISFDKMESSSLFVQKFILGEEPIDIHRLRSSYNTYQELLAVTKKVREQIVALDGLRTTLADLGVQQDTAERERLVAAIAKAEASRAENRRLKTELRQNREAGALAKAAAERTKGEIASYRTKVAAVLDRKSKLEQSSRKSELMGILARLDAARLSVLKPLIGERGIARQAGWLATLFGAISHRSDASADITRLTSMLDASGNPSLEFMPSDPAEVDALLARVRSAADGEIGEIKARAHGEIARQAAVKARIDDLKNRIAAINGNKIIRDRETEALLAALSAAGIEARVLCDIVEVNDDRWRDSAEAILGGSRETVFVAPADLDAVYAIARRDRKTFGNASIANTWKLERVAARERRGMLTSVLDTDDRHARAYLDQKFGNIQLAVSEQDFRKDGRWLTADGLFDDGSATKVLRPVTPKIGKAAAKRSLQGLLSDLDEAHAEERMITPAVQNLEEARTHFSAVAKIIEDLGNEGNGFEAAAAKARAIHDEMDETSKMLKELEIIDVSDLVLEIDEMNEEIARLELVEKTKDREATLADFSIRDIEVKLTSNDRTPGSTANLAAMSSSYRSERNATRKDAVWNILVGYVKRRATISCDDLSRQANAIRANAEKTIEGVRGHATAKAGHCIDLLEARSTMPPQPDLLRDVLPWAINTVSELREVVVLDHEDQLRKAQDESKEIFQTGFVNDLAGRFIKVKQDIGSVNALLRKYPFLGEIYQVKMTESPGYEAFHEVVRDRSSVDHASAGGGLLSYALENRDEVLEAMDKVSKTIFNDDITTNLDDFTDYRKYFTFDIEIKNEITGAKNTFQSRRGTGSGGEQQTPYYIALMTAMSNIYYGGPYSNLEPNAGGIALAVFDEAFNNMDEKVASQIVAFGKQLGLQLIVCGPSEKKATMQRNCDTVLTVTKSSDSRRTSVYPEYITQRTRDELLAIDPTRKSDDEMTDMMEAAVA